MGVQPFRIRDVAEGQFVQLLIAFTPKRVERQENGPCEKQSHAADHREYIEVPEEEEAFERRAIQDFNVWCLPEW